jgi:protein KRI1
VSPEAFGLTSLEILTASDAQLNEFIGLKKLASFRGRELKERDRRKYGKKKRLREWRKKIQEEGEDEEIKAVLRPDNPEPVNEATAGEQKKRRKSRKAKAKDGGEA